jgi:alkanesulfonate monooxygenase SsuD/methylene tetrahydromethanopterin reductase-like flavin-dependent oxidoreductase (luciferase family)
VIYLIRPIIAETDAIARELHARDKALRASDAFLEPVLANMSYFAQVDFSQFDLDELIPDLTGKVNGHQSTINRYYKDSVINKKTLRQVALTQDYVASIDLVGSPDTVAEMMGEAMDYVGGDGFFLSMFPLDRRTIATITEGLVPALRRRGLVRTHYEHKTFKENLLAF